MLRSDDPGFERFGEIYFSSISKGIIKAWRRHRASTSNLAVPIGAVRLALHDSRPDSPTRDQTMVIDIGDPNYALVTVPPGVWTGWQCLSDHALVANCATQPHSDDEVDRLPALAASVPYRWPE